LSRRKKIWTISIVAGLLVLISALVLAQPRARTALRLVRGFAPLQQDTRIYYESGAEDLAEHIALALPEAVARVEECHARPFKSGFRVYVCSLHENFTSRIGQPATDPVRGIAFLRDIWVSPKAFAFFGLDTRRQTLVHELSHLHLGQHLGWWSRTKNVPSWFMEGLADWAADTGHERVSRPEAAQAILGGHHLILDAAGHLPFPRDPRDYGLRWPMFHAQSRMFLEFCRSRHQEAFEEFVAAVVDGMRFEAAFQKFIGETLENMWQDFVVSLQT